MATHKYLEKYPSKTRPGKFIYKYEEGSGSLYGNTVGAERDKQAALARGKEYRKNKIQAQRKNRSMGTHQMMENKRSRNVVEPGSPMSARQRGQDWSTYKRNAMGNQSANRDRSANIHEVGADAAPQGNRLSVPKHYAKQALSTIESTASKAISSGKSFIDKLFRW